MPPGPCWSSPYPTYRPPATGAHSWRLLIALPLPALHSDLSSAWSCPPHPPRRRLSSRIRSHTLHRPCALLLFVAYPPLPRQTRPDDDDDKLQPSTITTPVPPVHSFGEDVVLGSSRASATLASRVALGAAQRMPGVRVVPDRPPSSTTPRPRMRRSTLPPSLSPTTNSLPP